MMMKKKYFVCVALWLSALAAVQAATPPAEKLLPADTLAVISVPDYAKACSSSAQMPLSQLLADPAMKPVKEKFMAKLRSDVVTPLEREFGIKLSDYAALAQGQLTLAITQNGWSGKAEETPGFLFLLDTKEKSGLLRTNLAEVKKKWTDAGKQLRTEKIRDQEFTTFIFSSDDLAKTLDKAFPNAKQGAEADKAKKPGKKMEWIVGQSDSLLIIGSSTADIEKLLIRQSGGSAPSLSEQAAFASSYGTLFRDALSYGWVNLKSIMEVVSKSTAGATPAKGLSPEKIMTALGLKGLQTLAFNVQNAEDGALVNLQLQAPDASRQGLLKILSFENKDANPPPFVPADALKFTRFRLDLQKSYAAIENTLTQIEPQYAGLLKTMVDLAGKDKDPQFDLRKQLIGNLGNDIISYEKAPRKQTLEELASAPSLFLVSSPRPEQLATALKAIVSFLPPALSTPKLKEREFLGRKVYTITMATMDTEGKRVDRSLHYAASGGYVALSYDVAMLEEYLRGSTSKTLAEMPGLAEAAQKVGGMNTGLFGFENQRETTRIALETLRKESGTVANLLSGSSFAGRLGMNENNNQFKDWVDFSLLPPFDQIAKYFYISVWSGALNADGLTVKIYSPVSPQLKAK